MNRLRLLGRAFRHRNYRLFFSGQCLSLIGTWMQQTALGWLVYRMTGSAFLLGLVAFAGQAPSFFAAPAAGVVVDRWNRHRVLLWTQSMSMIQASALAALVLTDTVQVWHILFLSVFMGLVNSFDMPARQSFVLQLVEDKKLLGNAIALNSSMVHLARMIGPPIAGLIIAVYGEGVCFLMNAVSYIAVLSSLLLMRGIPSHGRGHDGKAIQFLKEGFSYAFGFLPIRSIILLLAFTSLVGMPYMVLMPVFAKDIMLGDSHTLGIMMGAIGVGSLSGALFLASRKSVAGLEKIIPFASATLGVGLIAFSHVRFFPLALFVLMATGFGMMVQLTSSNSVLQTVVEEDKRGRVMSLYTMGFMGTVPFGSLIYGALAHRIGAPNTLVLGGICCLIGAFLFARRISVIRDQVSPIYVKLGIIPEQPRLMGR